MFVIYYSDDPQGCFLGHCEVGRIGMFLACNECEWLVPGTVEC